MIMFILIMLVGIILALLYFKAHRRDIDQKDEWVESPYFWKTIFIILLAVIVGIFQPYKMDRVDAGHVGIKVNLTGDNRGVGHYEYKTGWVVYNTWVSKLYEFPTFQQHIDYEAQNIITKGGFSASVKPSFSYSLKSGDVGDMFQNLRLDIKSIEQQWLMNAILGAINDVANKWTVDDIFNHREQFESDVVVEVNKRVFKWFVISQMRTQITPPEALRQSIELKTKAIQEVQVAENQRLVAIAEGDRKIAQARADSAAQVIAASGEAEAMRRKQLTITPLYIEFIKAQKWNGENSQVQAGSAGMMIQVTPRKE